MHAISIALLLMLVQKPDVPPVPSLVVSGNAQILTAPDEATVRLGIVRQAAGAQAAQEQANAVAQEIMNGLARLGVAAAEIQTSRLVLAPVYAPRSPESREAPRIVAYSATNTMSVRLSRLSLVGPVIDAGLKAGANQVEGVQFGLRNETPARQEALKRAVEEARSKAEVMAESLRVSLAEVLEASEGAVSVIPFADSAAQRLVMPDAGTPVIPGQIQIHANVTIKYRITPK